MSGKLLRYQIACSCQPGKRVVLFQVSRTLTPSVAWLLTLKNINLSERHEKVRNAIVTRERQSEIVMQLTKGLKSLRSP